MQVSLAMMGFGWTQDVAERCIEVAGSLGYDGIDLWKQYLDTADLGWVRDACAAQNLQIVQLCPYFDFTTSETTAADSLREAATFVGYAETLGAPYVRAYTGVTPSAEADDAMWARCVKGLQEACDMAAASDVTLLARNAPGDSQRAVSLGYEPDDDPAAGAGGPPEPARRDPDPARR